MKSHRQIAKDIKQILVDLACNDELPLDMNTFDTSVLLPAFYGGKKRYLTVDTRRTRKVYDTQKQQYIS